jgi:hypothetical protein
MNRFLLLIYGGKETSPDAWTAWYAGLGNAVIDAGGPAMPGKIVSAGGVKSAGTEPVTGYCIFQAGDLDSVVKMSKSCPIIAGGGQVAVYPITAMV